MKSLEVSVGRFIEDVGKKTIGTIECVVMYKQPATIPKNIFCVFR
jgi:hypothetical protein